MASTEIITEEGQVTAGPDMPEAMSEHSIAKFNQTTSIIIGGITSSAYYLDVTWFFNHVTQEFQPGPRLISGRRNHASATLQDQVTKEEIVAVVGGYNRYNPESYSIGGYLDSTEFLINGEWTQGK